MFHLTLNVTWKVIRSHTTVSHEVYLMTIYNVQVHVSAYAGHPQHFIPAEHTPTIASFFVVSILFCVVLIPGFVSVCVFCFY